MFNFKRKIKTSKITSERAKELLIDFKEPKTKEEKDYIKLQKEYAKEDGFDFYSKEYLEERQRICEGWRRIELRRGDKPKNPEEEQWVKEYKEYEEESKRKSEDFAKRNKAAEQEIIELLKKYKYTDYLPGHKFNNPIFNKRFKSIEDEVFELTVKKCVEKYDRVNTCFFADESVPIKQKILKDRYGYDWCPEGVNYCKEFWNEYNKIIEKYDMKFVDFLDNRR